jgi:hypothetical protein
MSRITDHNYAVGRPFARLSTNAQYDYTLGTIFTPVGFVAVYTQGGDDPYTSLDFIHEGRAYSRNFDGKTFTERGLVTVAHRFAKGIVGEEAK